MLGWLANIYKFITQEFDSIVKWVLSIIQAVYSFIDGLFNQLVRGLNDVWNALNSLFRQAWNFILQIYNILVAGIRQLWSDITSWVSRLWNDLIKGLDYLGRLLIQWVDYLLKWVQRLWNDLVAWIIRDIWTPLKTAILQAWNWITHEGAFIYDLITHPEKLIKILGHWLWISWLGLLRTYGKTIGRWLAHTMFGLVSEFMSILEEFIHGIL